jgi:hypothetical protein
MAKRVPDSEKYTTAVRTGAGPLRDAELVSSHTNFGEVPKEGDRSGYSCDLTRVSRGRLRALGMADRMRRRRMSPRDDATRRRSGDHSIAPRS